MAFVHFDLFWSHYLDHCELQRLEYILRQSDFSDTVDAIRAQYNFSGRLDWPVEAMLRSLFAISVLQHRSTESLRRELMRNPVALGFKLRSNAGGVIRILNSLTRYHRLLMEVEDKAGVLRAQFERQCQRFAGRKLASRIDSAIGEGMMSDLDASAVTFLCQYKYVAAARN